MVIVDIAGHRSTSTGMSHIIVFSLSVSLSKVTRVKNFGGIAQRTLNTMKDENEDSGQGARTIHDSFFRNSIAFASIAAILEPHGW